VAERFGNVLFVIHAAACACIGDAAAHRHEREVLFLPRSPFVIVRVTRDARGGAEIELRDVHTDPDFTRRLTPAEARETTLTLFSQEFGADRAEVLIDRAEGVALVNALLGRSPPKTAHEIELEASNFLAAWAAYRANPGRENEIRAWRRAEALRRLREDPRALFIAARSPTPNEMRRVIAAGAALDVRDERERTAAMIAAHNGSWRMLALLIDAGAEVANSRDRDGHTALQVAARRGRIGAVRVLLGAGVNPDARDSEGLSARVLGVHANQPAVVELLIRAGAAVDAAYLVRGRWWTPLHFACAESNAEMVRILLRAGADPSWQGSGEAFSPLDAAIPSLSAEVIRLLVEAGADLEAEGAIGLSAPDFAEEMAHGHPNFEGVAIRLRRAASGGLF
jgi:hypothetical protein